MSQFFIHCSLCKHFACCNWRGTALSQFLALDVCGKGFFPAISSSIDDESLLDVITDFFVCCKNLCFGCNLFIASWCVINKPLTTDCSERALELLILDVHTDYTSLSKTVRWVGKYKFLIDDSMSCHRSSCDFFGAVNKYGEGESSQAKGRKKRKWQNGSGRLHSGLETCFGEKADNIKIGRYEYRDWENGNEGVLSRPLTSSFLKH